MLKSRRASFRRMRFSLLCESSHSPLRNLSNHCRFRAAAHCSLLRIKKARNRRCDVFPLAASQSSRYLFSPYRRTRQKAGNAMFPPSIILFYVLLYCKLIDRFTITRRTPQRRPSPPLRRERLYPYASGSESPPNECVPACSFSARRAVRAAA